MTPRQVILEQIHHRETPHIPYTLTFEEDVETRRLMDDVLLLGSEQVEREATE